MGKRGKPASSPVCHSLKELLKYEALSGFIPWKVTNGGTTVFCFARTQQDAFKKVMSYISSALPCSVNEILEASQK